MTDQDIYIQSWKWLNLKKKVTKWLNLIIKVNKKLLKYVS